ncbi:MAG: single-stranded-DNA-specific exonuclease RecJ [Christensenellaceae bacterium]|nr:single-stranded-DNA-specific exonuclease RecJ [Christensenellaceae bacterium]
MDKWIVETKRADFQGLAARFGISPVLARIIRNRDVVGEAAVEEYLHGGPQHLHDPFLMAGMEAAVETLLLKVRAGAHIRIIGDYDIDGVCASYILLKGLERLGARVDVDIPDRITDGYGVNDRMVEAAVEDGADVILTCDNGIGVAAGEALKVAKEHGLTVIVTDHHEVPTEDDEEILPPVDVIVNPKQRACVYPFKGLCGGAIAVKLVQALYEKAGIIRSADLAAGTIPEPLLELWEFAALATVGDVMELKGENRILVKYGLRLMRETKNRGLAHLVDVNGIKRENLSAYHLGFIIGPCLNAGGRLETAKRSLRLLLSTGEEEAESLALELKGLNDQRKAMTQQGVEAAIEQIEGGVLKDAKVLVPFLPDCHESLAGIIAGRIRERYNKPTIVLTRAKEGLKGSGRSIETYSMFEKLQECKDLLSKFGGHPMAAGLSLPEENLEVFRKRLNEASGLTEEDFRQVVRIDVPMPISYISERFIKELEYLEPCGNGNTKPVFAEQHFSLLSAQILGKNRNVLKMRVENREHCQMDALYFGDIETFFAFLTEEFGAEEVEKLRRGKANAIDVAFTYYPGINEFRGTKALQITVQQYCRIRG